MKRTKISNWMKMMLCGLVAAGTLAWSPFAVASPLANDPFLTGVTPASGQYTVGNLSAQNPTVAGFSGAWATGAGGTILATNLIYSNANYTAPAGGSITTPNQNRVSRSLDAATTAALTTTANGTVYMSFLGNFGGGVGPWGYAALELGTGTADSTKALAIGLDSSVSGNFMYQINNGTKTSLGVAVNANTHLFLVKFNLSTAAASDSIQIWVDPALGGVGDPSGGTTVSGLNLLAINDIRLGSGAVNNLDELRFGTTLADVLVPPTNSPPSIAQGPVSTTGYVGWNMNFSVTVNTNNSTPTYQWVAGATGSGVYTNLVAGAKYSGVTNSVLKIGNLALTDALDYAVVVANAYGSVTSSPATLTVNAAQDELISADCSQSGTPNQTDAAVLGAPGDIWNAFRSGAAATYATIFDTANTTLPNVAVVLSNSGGSGANNNGTGNNTGGSLMDAATTPLMQDYIYKNGGTLQVTIQNLDAFVGRQFGLVLFCAGDQAGQGPTNITVLSGGSGGNTLSNLTVTAATRKISDGAGVAFTYFYGTLTNKTLTVQMSKAVDYLGMNGFQFGLYTNQYPVPSIAGQPQPYNGFVGNTVILSAKTVSFGAETLQWQAGAVGSGVYTNISNGGNVSGATSEALAITGATAAQALDYVLVAANSSGSVTSQVATVTLIDNNPPTVAVDTTPASLTRYTGATVSFSALFSGNQPITNHWQFSADNTTYADIPGATTTNLTLNNLQLTNGGYYRLVATNAFGSGASTPAQLTVSDVTNALINWSAPVPFGSLSVGQIFTNPPGSLLGGVNFGGPAITVTWLGKSLTFAAQAGSTMATCNGNGAVGSGFIPYSTTSSTNFDQVLDTFRYMFNTTTPIQVTINNLIEGETYSVQLFAVDDRGGFSVFPANFADANDANDVSQTYTVGSNSYLIGTFKVPTGSGGSVTIQENIENGSGICALALRAISFSVPSVPETITTTVSASSLQLAWPTKGWRLQEQTNSLSTGLGTNWVDVPDSTTTNQIILPVVPGNDSVFYRLVYP